MLNDSTSDMMRSRMLCWIALILAFAAVELRAADSKECEVCIAVLDKIDESLVGKDKKSKPKIEAAIDKFCSKKELSASEKKVCYYLDPIKRDVAQPFSLGMAKPKVCERLKKTSAEICTVKFPVKVDSQTDYSKLRVKELKAILSQRGVDCNGCLEKPDYVKRAVETAHLDLPRKQQ